jgi:hypothetical protein
MSQNRSHAVMAQRAEPSDSLDFFPTHPWATRALCEHVLPLKGRTVWEPAAGKGDMVRPLREYADIVVASDVHDYGEGDETFFQHDFLMPYVPFVVGRAHWIITNPPFRLAEQFITRGLEIAREGVAVLVRSVSVESVGRYENLFSVRPPSIIAQFVERVPMVKGRLDKDASTATSYAWLVFERLPSGRPTRFVWIPPCRKKLERPGDYDGYPREAVQ